MAKNDFKAFATDRNANVMSQEEWEALPALLSGFTAGKASSAQVNKVIRQASFIAAALAQFVSDKTQRDVLDNGDLPGFVELLGSGFAVEYLSRKNPFGDIKSDGTVETALENLGLGASAFGLKNVVYYTSAQVVQWPVPDILKQGRRCYVVVIGGGASGAYGNATAGGTGGSSGGRSEKIVDLTGVDAVTVTVGAGGEPVTKNNTGGNAGGTSSFGTYLSATGATATNIFSSQPGGKGIGGDVNIAGFPGAPAVVCSTDGKRTGGNGGGPGAGSGKYDAAQQGAESERNARFPGSGGAGLAYYSGLTGYTGRGADGAVYIYW